jgi:hypothetical protein
MAKRAAEVPVGASAAKSRRVADANGAPLSEDVWKKADDAFRWLIHPLTPEVFFQDYWEVQPLVIQRDEASRGHWTKYLKDYNVEALKRYIQAGRMSYGKDIDVALYKDGVRTTPNGTGEGQPYVRHILFLRGSAHFSH